MACVVCGLQRRKIPVSSSSLRTVCASAIHFLFRVQALQAHHRERKVVLKNYLYFPQTFLFKSHPQHPQEQWVSVWRSLLHVMASIRSHIHTLFIALFLFSGHISIICRKKYLNISEKHRKKFGLDSVWSAESCSRAVV